MLFYRSTLKFNNTMRNLTEFEKEILKIMSTKPEKEWTTNDLCLTLFNCDVIDQNKKMKVGQCLYYLEKDGCVDRKLVDGTTYNEKSNKSR